VMPKEVNIVPQSDTPFGVSRGTYLDRILTGVKGASSSVRNALGNAIAGISVASSVNVPGLGRVRLGRSRTGALSAGASGRAGPLRGGVGVRRGADGRVTTTARGGVSGRAGPLSGGVGVRRGADGKVTTTARGAVSGRAGPVSGRAGGSARIVDNVLQPPRASASVGARAGGVRGRASGVVTIQEVREEKERRERDGGPDEINGRQVSPASGGVLRDIGAPIAGGIAGGVAAGLVGGAIAGATRFRPEPVRPPAPTPVPPVKPIPGTIVPGDDERAKVDAQIHPQLRPGFGVAGSEIFDRTIDQVRNDVSEWVNFNFNQKDDNLLNRMNVMEQKLKFMPPFLLDARPTFVQFPTGDTVALHSLEPLLKNQIGGSQEYGFHDVWEKANYQLPQHGEFLHTTQQTCSIPRNEHKILDLYYDNIPFKEERNESESADIQRATAKKARQMRKKKPKKKTKGKKKGKKKGGEGNLCITSGIKG